MANFISGATMLACLATAVFFLRFWRRTHDRFFLLFAAGFAVLGLNRVAILLSHEGASEATATIFYAVRLAAYVLLLAAILDKNRSSAPPAPSANAT